MISLRTAAGTAIRSGSGFLLLPGLIPWPGIPQPLDPTGTVLPKQPFSIRSSQGILLRTRNGFLLLQGYSPVLHAWLRIFGQTKDSSGNPLASCVVTLYRTSDDKLMERQTSDASGNYSFTTAGLGEAYYIVAYLAGSPDVSGTTVNTLTGA